MKKLPIGIQIFRNLIDRSCLYVDKTMDVHDLISCGGRYYFLSRPPCFGKSLLISTMAEIFSGNKELFKELWIYDKIEWTQHPVVHLDLSQVSFDTPEMLEKALGNRVEQIAAENDIQLDKELFLKEKFGQLLKKLSQKQKVVVLIDEYDKPMIEYIEADDIDKAKQIRRVLKHFYGVIKSSDAYLRFVFITGVSKFSKVSVFSDLNNLIDITLYEQYATLLGYTEAEMEKYFSPYMAHMAEKRGMTVNALAGKVQKWYNGYSWDGKNFVYNPFSILNLFNVNRFGNFWFSTGTPTFLIQMIKNQQIDIMELENLLVGSFIFDSEDIENMDAAAILFQAGYLTIKKVTIEDVETTYELSYPNHV